MDTQILILEGSAIALIVLLGGYAAHWLISLRRGRQPWHVTHIPQEWRTTSLFSHDQSSEQPQVNPATGMPMHGLVDMGGNLFGSNSNSMHD